MRARAGRGGRRVGAGGAEGRVSSRVWGGMPVPWASGLSVNFLLREWVKAEVKAA